MHRTLPTTRTKNWQSAVPTGNPGTDAVSGHTRRQGLRREGVRTHEITAVGVKLGAVDLTEGAASAVMSAAALRGLSAESLVSPQSGSSVARGTSSTKLDWIVTWGKEVVPLQVTPQVQLSTPAPPSLARRSSTVDVSANPDQIRPLPTPVSTVGATATSASHVSVTSPVRLHPCISDSDPDRHSGPQTQRSRELSSHPGRCQPIEPPLPDTTQICERGHLNCEISSDLRALQRLHEEFSWIPSAGMVRCSSELQAQKERHVEVTLRKYHTMADQVLYEVFGCPTATHDDGRLVAVISDSMRDRKRIARHPFPYKLPLGTRHYIMWCVSLSRPPYFSFHTSCQCSYCTTASSDDSGRIPTTAVVLRCPQTHS